jgi:hypothetical protein
MRRIQAKLTEPTLQERLKEAQMMDQAFNEWQKDASRLKRSPDYRQKIQQINDHYLETGEFPTEQAVNAMQQDFKQADQLTAQVERSYGDS